MLKAVRRVDLSIIKANRKQKIKGCQQEFFKRESESGQKKIFYSLNLRTIKM